MTQFHKDNSLEGEFTDLELDFEQSASMASTFSSSLSELVASLSSSSTEVKSLSQSLNTSMKRALSDLIVNGESASSVLQQLGSSMLNSIYASAVDPILNNLGNSISGGILSLVAPGAANFAGVGSFSSQVTPFAKGGVISSATVFPVRSGMGLMGEAGPEAIMPLERGADGRLGVRSNGGSVAPNIVFNISTPDVEGFRRTQGQISGRIARILETANRNS